MRGKCCATCRESEGGLYEDGRLYCYAKSCFTAADADRTTWPDWGKGCASYKRAARTKVLPILFRPEMVRAILAGKKTQTRRTNDARYSVGDQLWVREAYRAHAEFDHLPPRDIPGSADLQYEADRPLIKWDSRYRHARFMPKRASRLTLEVTAVKTELLQDISEEDCLAEGAMVWADEKGLVMPADFQLSALRFAMRSLWDSINGDDGKKCWASNPPVVALEFRVHRTMYRR